MSAEISIFEHLNLALLVEWQVAQATIDWKDSDPLRVLSAVLEIAQKTEL